MASGANIMTEIIQNTEEGLKKYRAKIFKAKDEYRKELARLPFEKKIEILVGLQKRAECLKKFKLIHPKFVGKIICNTNQGGITSIVQSVKMTKEELGSWLMADGGENDKNRKS